MLVLLLQYYSSCRVSSIGLIFTSDTFAGAGARFTLTLTGGTFVGAGGTAVTADGCLTFTDVTAVRCGGFQSYLHSCYSCKGRCQKENTLHNHRCRR